MAKKKEENQGFLKYVVMLASGSGFASLFSILIIPIISRLFNPDDYGVAAVFVSLATLIGSVSPLRYERAAVLPKEREEALQLMMLAMFCAIGIQGLFFLIISSLWFGGMPLPYQNELGMLIFLLPFTALLVGINFVLEMWLVRSRQFKRVAFAEVADPVSNGSTRLALGSLVGSAVWPLICGLLLGYLLKFGVYFSATWASVKEGFRIFSPARLRELAIRYKDFPLLNAPSGFINRLATDLPLLLFGVIHSPEVVGLYAIAMRLLQTPVNVCSQAIRKVYHPRAAQSVNRRQKVMPLLLKIVAGCAAVAVIPFSILFFCGEDILAWILGEKWREAGLYCEIMVPWLFMMWATMPCAVLVEVLRKQGIWLYVQITHVTLRAGAFGLAYWHNWDAVVTLNAFVLVCVLGNFLVLWLGIHYASVHDKGLAKQ